MKDPEPAYVIRCWFEWGAGCFWAGNDAAQARFGAAISPEVLPLSEATIRRANDLAAWHNQALNWAYPPDPGPWRQEECDRFNQAAKDLLTTVRQELGPSFAVIDQLVEEKEDPDLDAYLRDPKGCNRQRVAVRIAGCCSILSRHRSLILDESYDGLYLDRSY